MGWRLCGRRKRCAVPAVFQHGVKCAGVISPLNKFGGEETKLYDVIVVGAGYAGLTACRDLCIAGKLFVIILARRQD
jgi:NADPH-dependent 2,4-dienoyl-CoA reductase/sulfur reductase-like enzyme